MGWHLNSPLPACDVCGRYIGLTDLQEGRAIHRMLEPDSDISMEKFETLCAQHYTPSGSGSDA